MTPAQRLSAAAHLQKTDRPPCICPGGMMNMIVADVMERANSFLPFAHSDPHKMAALTRTLYECGGFENYGVPFCMTVEAEALGAKADLGDCTVEPHVIDAPLSSAAQIEKLQAMDLHSGRCAAVLEAIRILKARDDGVPVVGNITGPVSVAGTVVDMSKLLMEFIKQPEDCHRLLRFICDNLIAYGQAQLAAGADAICIAEPSGTGEILGKRLF